MSQALSLPEKVRLELPAIISEHVSAGTIDPNRIVAGIAHLVVTNPMLRECEWESLVSAVVRSVRAGLDCTGMWGEGWIIPYRDKKRNKTIAEFVPGYRGLIKLALQGNCTMLEARLVYENDEFAIDYGTQGVLAHRPCLTGNRGAVIGAYALAWIRGSPRPLIEYMTSDEINAIAARSKMADGGPWKTDWGEMARKTVVRRLVKYLDLSAAAKDIIERADRVEFDFESGADSHPVALPPKSSISLSNASEAIKALKAQSKVGSVPDAFLAPPEAAQARQEQAQPTDSQAIAETVDKTDAENAESQVFAYYENAITQCQNKDRLPQIVQDVLADNRLSKEEKEMLRGYARSMWQSMK